MKKLFFFKSSSSTSNVNSNQGPSLPSNNDRAYWEKPPANGAECQGNNLAEYSSQYRNGMLSKSGEQYKDSPASAGSLLRRSLSFSSPNIYGDLQEKNSIDLSDHNRSHSSGNNVHPHIVDNRVRCRSLTPTRQTQPERSAQTKIQVRHAIEKSPNSARVHFDSSGNSPYSSPVPLKCRAARLPQAQNEFLDLYIDGEQKDRNLRPEIDSQKANIRGKDCPLIESKKIPFSKRPPRGRSAVTPMRDLLNSQSSWESRNDHAHISNETMGDDARPSLQNLSKVVERLPQVLSQASMESSDFDSVTTMTTEDIFEDYSERHSSFNSNSHSQKMNSSQNMHFVSDTSHEALNGFCNKEIPGFLNQFNLHDRGLSGSKHEENVEADLWRKGKDAEERVLQLEHEFEKLKLQDCGSIPTLLQTIEKLTQDRISLALEVSSVVRNRISDRASMAASLKQAKVDLDVRTRRLEREKSELQATLEKELDRRSNDWSFKLEKYQCEEQRLRDRVRELAEQNVSLQREVSSLKNKEVSVQNGLTQLAGQVKEVTGKLEETKAENHNLRQELLELQENTKGLEGDLHSIKRSYKSSETANKEFQRVVARLKMTCSEQDKTINGLRLMLGDDVSKQSPVKGDDIVALKLEHARLTGIELMLRKEVESYRNELESLRNENINLLERLKVTQNSGTLSLIKLDQEFTVRIEYLQNQCLALLDEKGQLCSKLLEFIKSKTCNDPDISSEDVQQTGRGFDGYSILEYEMKFQSLNRGTENLKRCLQKVDVMLKEKLEIDKYDSSKQSADISASDQLKRHGPEGDVEFELKAETLLTKVLREKLFHKELEHEQLQAVLASSARVNDILKCENQRSKDAISSLSHKTKELELQMLKKDETVNQTRSDLQECMKELSVTRGILPKVSQERDLMWEEVKQYSENNMLLNREVTSLRKKIELLEEDMLLKEGQITILKDSLDRKPFDILCSPESLKEFTLE